MIKRILATSVFLLFSFVAVRGADDQSIPRPAKPQNGVFSHGNGYTFTVLELNDGHFRFWFATDDDNNQRSQYPLQGEYVTDGDTIVLKNDAMQTLNATWSFRTIKGVLSLWTPAALKIYSEDKSFDRYGILRISDKTAEELWRKKAK